MGFAVRRQRAISEITEFRLLRLSGSVAPLPACISRPPEMRLQNLGQEVAHSVMIAIENILDNSPQLTPDMRGTDDTISLGKAIEASI